jgi:hypothetical protein
MIDKQMYEWATERLEFAQKELQKANELYSNTKRIYEEILLREPSTRTMRIYYNWKGMQPKER